MGHLEKQGPTGSVSKKPAVTTSLHTVRSTTKTPQTAGPSSPGKPHHPATQEGLFKNLGLGNEECSPPFRKTVKDSC